MKKIVSIAISFIMIISTFLNVPSTVSADEQYYNWLYRSNNTHTQCIITGYTGNKSLKAVFIPSHIDGMEVIDVSMSFGDCNFETACFYEDCVMKELPSFRGSKGLKRIDVIDANTNTLKENCLPDSITKIGSGALAGTSIKTLTMPNVTEVDSWNGVVGAFEGCDELKTLIFGKPAKIGGYAFEKNNCNCEITYPGPVSEWTSDAVLYSPNIVVNCNNGSFGWCGDAWDGTYYDDSCLYWTLDNDGKLSISTINNDSIKFDYPDLQIIKKHNWNNDKVKSISLNGVAGTGKKSFQNTKLDNVVIPDSVKTIGESSFANCYDMKTIFIPSSVKRIEPYALAYSGLMDIYYDGGKADWDYLINHSNCVLSGISSSCKIHTRSKVDFDANGHGSAPASQTNLWSNEDKVKEPAALSDSKYEFTGWYTDKELTNKWDFDKTVRGDMTLYAGWKQVVFDIKVTSTAGGSAQADRSSAMKNDNVFLSFTPNDGYYFKEWQVVSGDFDVEYNHFKMPEGDAEVKAVFAPIENDVEVVASGKGTVSVDNPHASFGQTVTLTATPDEGWSFKGWEVFGGDVTITDNQFTMPKTYVVIRGVFEKIEHSVTVTSTEGGSAWAGFEKASMGDYVTVSAVCDRGYKFVGWQLVSGSIDIADVYNYFVMPNEDVEIKAIFEPLKQSNVTVTTDGNGDASAEYESAYEGETVNLTATPKEGYRFKEWQLDSGDASLNDDSLVMGKEDVAVKAIFEKIPQVYKLHGDNVSFFDDHLNKITEAEVGTHVTVSINDETIPKGYYFTDEYLSNCDDLKTNEVGDGEFTMPTHDVSVTIVLAEREIYNVYLTDNEPVTLPKDMAGNIMSNDEYSYDDNLASGVFDFNHDGVYDALLDFENENITRYEGADSLTEDCVVKINTPGIPYRYKEVVFRFTHALVEINAKAATCNEEGNNKYYFCKDCNTYFEDDKATHITTAGAQIIEALGHDFSEKWSSNKNEHWHACSRCGEISDKAAHTWDKGKITKNATSTAMGEKTYTCTVCGATKIESIPKCAKYKNTITVKGKKKTIKYKKLKKKKQSIARKKVITIKNAKGTITYKKIKGNKKITINKKTGKITVKKKTKKGTYKVKIKVKAAGNNQYMAGTKTVTVKIKVK